MLDDVVQVITAKKNVKKSPKNQVSLGLSAVKKVLEACGGSIEMLQYESSDKSDSEHVIELKIPCRKNVTTRRKHRKFGLIISDSSRSAYFSHDNSSRNVVNMDINVARHVMDFGMDFDLEGNLSELVSEVFGLFSLHIKPILVKESNLNMFRVIFVDTMDKCSIIRNLEYKGLVVLIGGDKKFAGCDYSIRDPHNILTMDKFFRSLSRCQVLAHKPNFLSIFDKAFIALNHYDHIPLVSMLISVLQRLNNVNFSITKFLGTLSPLPKPYSLKYAALASSLSPTTGTPLINQTFADLEVRDFEFLKKSSIVASSTAWKTIRIADNFLCENLYPKIRLAEQGTGIVVQ